MNIGSKLKKVRLDLNLKLKDVSKASNLSLSYISDIENNRSVPPLNTLTTLCKVLNIELYDLFKNDQPTPLKASKENQILYHLLENFDEWPQMDKDELISYLRVKQQSREEPEPI